MLIQFSVLVLRGEPLQVPPGAILRHPGAGVYVYSYYFQSVSRAVPFFFLGTAQGVLLSAARPQAKAWRATALRVYRATWAE